MYSNEDKESTGIRCMNHSNKFGHPAHDDEQQQQAAASSSIVATHRAAAEIYGRNIHMHARTSYSRVQLSSIVTIYQVPYSR